MLDVGPIREEIFVTNLAGEGLVFARGTRSVTLRFQEFFDMQTLILYWKTS